MTISTPAPWHVGAQNDTIYVIAGRAPSMNNDYPVHDADRTALARIYDLPDRAGYANALLMAAAPDLLDACGYALAVCDQGEVKARLRDAIRKANAPHLRHVNRYPTDNPARLQHLVALGLQREAEQASTPLADGLAVVAAQRFLAGEG